MASVHSVAVLKYGALGDFFQNLPAFLFLRRQFPNAALTLITSPEFAESARELGLFDQVLLDDRKKSLFSPGSLKDKARLLRFLRQTDLAIDLQNSGRTALYRLLSRREHPGPRWIGVPRSLLRPGRPTPFRQIHEREKARIIFQNEGWLGLNNALEDFPPPLSAQGQILLNGKSVVLAPCAGSRRIEKLWPASRFRHLAEWLASEGWTPVLIGDRADRQAHDAIAAAVPKVQNLTGRTTLPELAGILAQAALVTGSDTGPLHLAAALGRPTLTLFSHASDPRKCAPRGGSPGLNRILMRRDLGELQASQVIATLKDWKTWQKA